MVEIIAKNVWKNVDRRGEDECWHWTGSTNSSGAGHGVAYIGNGRSMAAHRAVYQLVVEPIPDGLVCDHLCRNPQCVNPRHIDIVTQKINTQRGNLGNVTKARNAAITHCPQGHEYSEENTRWGKLTNGYMARSCRECGRIRSRAAYQRRKDQS